MGTILTNVKLVGQASQPCRTNVKFVKMGSILTNFTLFGLTNLSFQCRATPAASVDNIVT